MIASWNITKRHTARAYGKPFLRTELIIHDLFPFSYRNAGSSNGQFFQVSLRWISAMEQWY